MIRGVTFVALTLLIPVTRTAWGATGTVNNYNNCHTPKGYLGIWKSTADSSTWPKPTDSFNWDAGDTNAQGFYLANSPKPGDGFFGQEKTVKLTGGLVSITLRRIARGNVNGDIYK